MPESFAESRPPLEARRDMAPSRGTRGCRPSSGFTFQSSRTIQAAQQQGEGGYHAASIVSTLSQVDRSTWSTPPDELVELARVAE